MSVSVSVAAAGCLFFFMLHKLITKQNGAYFILIYLLSLVIFMAGFYSLQGNADKNTLSLFDSTGILNHLSIPLHIFAKSLGQLIYLFYIYLIVLGILLFKTGKTKEYRPLILLCSSLIISGLLGWSLFFQFQDAAQLFVISAIPILHLLIIYLSVAMLAELKQQKVFALSIILLLAVSGIESITTACNTIDGYKKQVYSDTYLKQVKEAVSKMINNNGISITAASDYHSVFDKNPYFGEPGSYLKLMGSRFNTTSISVLDMPFDSTNELDYKREMFLGMSTPFFQFFANYKHNWNANDISVTDIQKEFSATIYSGFAILSKHAVLDTGWTSMIRQTIVDSISGERFLVFMPSLKL
jgi:hypothetical protein